MTQTAHKTPRVSEAVVELTARAKDAIRQEQVKQTESKSARLVAGQALLDLKTMIDADSAIADGMTFWQWFDYAFDNWCSRKDAEKRIALARSDDPDGALAAERERARKGMAKLRAKNAPANRANVSGSETKPNQSLTAMESEDDVATQPKRTEKAQSDEVVSLRVQRIVESIRSLSGAERRDLFAQLRAEKLL